MDILRGFDMENEKDKKMYNNIFDLLSYEKINFNGTTVLNLDVLCLISRYNLRLCQ